MFTVKATYRGETRKFSFSECNTFPSFDQLYKQLYRVFPISHNYFLSKLLFSPDSTQPSRILLSREVHSAEEYINCLAPYKGRSWASALLKFSVVDETPHKLPSIIASDSSQSFSRLSEPWAVQSGRNGVATTGATGDRQAQSTPISMFHIPPPPIIFSSSSRGSSVGPMDVDYAAADLSNQMSDISLLPRRIQTPQQSDTPKPCCAVGQGKAEVQALLSSFKEDIDRILTATFGSEPPIMTPPPTVPLNNGLFARQPVSTCFSCTKPAFGSRYSCQGCHTVLCSECHERGDASYCFATWGPHNMRLDTFPAAFGFPMASAPVWPGPPPLPAPPAFQWATAPQPGMTGPNSTHNSFYPFGAPTPVIPFIPPHTVFSPATSLPDSPVIPQATPTAPVHAPMTSGPQAPIVAPPPPPVIHQGIVCDMCNRTIEGVRHKCLDCPDYDLCTACITSGSAERHNPFHEFFEINEPGRVVVHTVFSGDGEMDVSPAAAAPAPTPAPVVPQEVALHNATCDLCDSRIRGDRYKCLECPDFDTCSSCFSITPEQHPRHGFAKITKAEDYIRRGDGARPMHFASCNVCNNAIYGIRYKCMHPECPDFDLCEGCEAHPIAVHPDNHPLLKMKSTETVVPTVYRVGQTTLIEQDRGRSPLPRILHDSQVEASRSRSRNHSTGSFGRGYIRNPYIYDDLEPRVRSFGPQPPSPFYSRSPSPPTFYCRSPSAPTQPIHSAEMPPVFSGFGEDTEPYEFCASPPPRSRSSSRSRSPRPLIIHVPHTPAGRVYLPPRSSSSSRSNSPPGRPDRSCSWPSRSGEPLVTPIGEWRPVVFDTPRTNADGQDLAAPESTTDITLVKEERVETWARPVSWERLQQLIDQERANFGEMVEMLAKSESSGTASEKSVGLNKPVLKQIKAETEKETTADESSTVMESPLTGEALLNRPSAADVPEMQHATSANRSLAALLSGYQSSLLTASSSLVASASGKEDMGKEESPVAAAEVLAPLSADYMDDVTVTDGQIFPPGAEFVKCWRMKNDGTRDWPAATELVFVAGEVMSRDGEKAEGVRIGEVKVGQEVDLWTGELKAPDAPGRYVGYWRLRDEQGQLFGHSIWIDITVAETSHTSEHNSDESMASSSIIIMPQAAGSAQATSVGLRGMKASSSGGSDASSVSLLSMPSTDDEDWQDSRSRAEFVVVYESSEEA